MQTYQYVMGICISNVHFGSWLIVCLQWCFTHKIFKCRLFANINQAKCIKQTVLYCVLVQVQWTVSVTLDKTVCEMKLTLLGEPTSKVQWEQ